MGDYDELKERDEIIKRLDEGQMLHRRSRKNFLISYRLLILASILTI